MILYLVLLVKPAAAVHKLLSIYTTSPKFPESLCELREATIWLLNKWI